MVSKQMLYLDLRFNVVNSIVNPTALENSSEIQYSTLKKDRRGDVAHGRKTGRKWTVTIV